MELFPAAGQDYQAQIPGKRGFDALTEKEETVYPHRAGGGLICGAAVVAAPVLLRFKMNDGHLCPVTYLMLVALLVVVFPLKTNNN